MPSSTFVLEGIDVSSNKGPVDWQAVTAGTFLFAYLRATIGAHTADSQFAGNWVRIRRTKLLRGAYHYFWPLADPAEQANKLHTDGGNTRLWGFASGFRHRRSVLTSESRPGRLDDRCT